jgi:hypothetical protein
MITLTGGNIQDGRGNLLNGFVTLQLTQDAAILATPGQVVRAIPLTFQFANGNLVGTCKCYSNAELTPGTQYQVSFADGNRSRLGDPTLWQFTQAAGATVDIGTMISTQPGITFPAPVVLAPGPGQNQNIVQQAGTSLNVNRFENIRFADQFASLSAAIADLGGSPGTVAITSALGISSNLVVPSTCTLLFYKGGILNIATATTVTINSAVIAPEDAAIFSLTGTGAVAGLSFTRPEWFGGTTSAAVTAAYNSLSSNGGTIKFRVGTYVSPWISLPTQITKTNVELAGSGQPDYNSQTAPTALSGGTILQGPVWVQSAPAGPPANGFYIHDLGVDGGSAVCTALFAGVAQQGVFLNNNFSGGSVDGPAFIENVRIINVTTLGQSTASAVHSILIDNGDGAIIQNVKTFFNIYGVVAKGQRYTINGVYSRGHSSVGLYIKSDSGFGIAQDTNISNVHLAQAVAAGDTAGMLIDSQATQKAQGVNITNFTARGTISGLSIAGTNTFTPDVTLNGFVIDSTTNTAIALGGTFGTARATISNGIINSPAAGDGIALQNTNVSDCLINNVVITNVVAGNGITNSGTRTKVSNVQVITTSGFGVFGSAGTMSVEGLTGSANASGLLGATAAANLLGATKSSFPNEIVAVDLTGQTAAIGTTTLNPATLLAGQYRLSWNAKITTAAATSSTLGPMTVTYTDPDGVSISQAVNAMPNGQVPAVGGVTNNNTLTILIGVPIMLNCKAGTNVTYSFAYASNAANTMAYNLHLRLEAL